MAKGDMHVSLATQPQFKIHKVRRILELQRSWLG